MATANTYYRIVDAFIAANALCRSAAGWVSAKTTRDLISKQFDQQFFSVEDDELDRLAVALEILSGFRRD